MSPHEECNDRLLAQPSEEKKSEKRGGEGRRGEERRGEERRGEELRGRGEWIIDLERDNANSCCIRVDLGT
eukprot:748752-Hanusia_phi.AAC.1